MEETQNKEAMKNLTSVPLDSGNIVVGVKNQERYLHLPFNKKDKYFMDPNDFIKFIKAVESFVRSSKEYSRYIAYLKNTVGLRNCAIFSEIDDSVAPIEMHHGPIFTLYDIVEIEIAHLFKKGEPINSANVTRHILKDHFDNIIQVTMLCEMAHVYVHAFAKTKDPRFFLSGDGSWGDFGAFVEKYHESLNLQHIQKIQKYLSVYDEFTTPEKRSAQSELFKSTLTDWNEKLNQMESEP